MVEKISQEELSQIVEEVNKLASQNNTNLEFNRSEVEEILTELNLPPELLDDAMIQLQRRKALAKQKRRNLLIGIGVVAALIGGVTTITLINQKRQDAFASISVYQSRLTLSNDNGGDITTINRDNSSEVFYRVTLENAPQGEKLPLKCNWIDPNGRIARQNNYKTRPIDKEVWNTHCRNGFGSAAPVGNWQVEMLFKNRRLSSKSFEVK